MSEYSWEVRKVWIGVKEYHRAGCGELLGVIRRSGRVRALGHFCFVRVSYMGKKRWASGAESRIYPFHSVQLEEGETAKGLELLYLGFTIDGNTAAFLDQEANVVELVDAGSMPNNTRPIPRAMWKDEWEQAVQVARGM